MRISNGAQLLVSVQVPNDVEILAHILFCKSVEEKATGRAIFEGINDIFSEQKSSGSGVNLYAQMTQQRWRVSFHASLHG
jgi:hypothetical protein